MGVHEHDVPLWSLIVATTVGLKRGPSVFADFENVEVLDEKPLARLARLEHLDD